MSFKCALLSGKVYDTLSLEDGLVLYKKRIYIPDSNDLKLTVTRQCHDAKVAGHFGRDKTSLGLYRVTGKRITIRMRINFVSDREGLIDGINHTLITN